MDDQLTELSERINPGNYRITVEVEYHENNPYRPSEPIVSQIFKQDTFCEGLEASKVLEELKLAATSAVFDDMSAEVLTAEEYQEDKIDNEAKSIIRGES